MKASRLSSKNARPASTADSPSRSGAPPYPAFSRHPRIRNPHPPIGTLGPSFLACAKGTIFCFSGNSGGHALFLKAGKLNCVYHFLAIKETEFTSVAR